MFEKLFSNISAGGANRPFLDCPEVLTAELAPILFTVGSMLPQLRLCSEHLNSGQLPYRV